MAARIRRAETECIARDSLIFHQQQKALPSRESSSSAGGGRRRRLQHSESAPVHAPVVNSVAARSNLPFASLASAFGFDHIFPTKDPRARGSATENEPPDDLSALTQLGQPHNTPASVRLKLVTRQMLLLLCGRRSNS
jgi:hypothetical protein